MSESLRGRSAGQYSAHEAVLRAFGYLERISSEEHGEVREILEAAVAAAPGHSDCQAMLSLIYCHEYANGYNARPDPLGRAYATAQRAVATAPTNHLARYVLATVLFFQIDVTDSGAACLAMVCQHFSRPASLARIRQVVHTGPAGPSLRSLCRGAEELGLAARSVQAEPPEQKPSPATVSQERYASI